LDAVAGSVFIYLEPWYMAELMSLGFYNARSFFIPRDIAGLMSLGLYSAISFFVPWNTDELLCLLLINIMACDVVGAIKTVLPSKTSPVLP